MHMEAPKVSSDSYDEEEVAASPLVITAPSPEVEKDEHCIELGELKVVIRNPTATVVSFSDAKNVW